jgi:hypothetical protein
MGDEAKPATGHFEATDIYRHVGNSNTYCFPSPLEEKIVGVILARVAGAISETAIAEDSNG